MTWKPAVAAHLNTVQESCIGYICSANAGRHPNSNTRTSNRRIPTKAMGSAKYSREYRNSRPAFIGYETQDLLFVGGGMLARCVLHTFQCRRVFMNVV